MKRILFVISLFTPLVLFCATNAVSRFMSKDAEIDDAYYVTNRTIDVDVERIMNEHHIRRKQSKAHEIIFIEDTTRTDTIRAIIRR